MKLGSFGRKSSTRQGSFFPSRIGGGCIPWRYPSLSSMVERADPVDRTVPAYEMARSITCGFRLWRGPHLRLSFCALIVFALLDHRFADANNSDARIVLHAQPYATGNNCSTPQQTLGLNCDSVRPTVTVAPGQAVEVYVYFHSYDSVAGAQMAFTWHPSWTFVYWVGACRGHELLAVPIPQVSGDSYVGAFDPVIGGQLQPLGRIRLLAGNSGTQFTITETWAPGGTGIIDDQLAFTPISSINRGVVVVDAPGVDSCGGKSESSALFEE